MILIDAIYINYGGALGLLKYLVETLVLRDEKFFLLADARCKGVFAQLPHVEYQDASEKLRKLFYKSHDGEFSAVFCFGNVPPVYRLRVPVSTYFHNVNMLTLQNCCDWKQKMKFWMKRTYIKSLRRNTDVWFVQTSNTAKELTKHLGVSNERIKLYPFYKLPIYPQSDKPRTDYIFVGEYSGSKGHDELLEAWKQLHKQGADLTLHLTVNLGEEYLKKVKEAVAAGVRIVNHGFVSMEELAKLYMQCKATVYPSYNESFGLGLVEAMEAGCDVIASNRPFVHAICDPSCTFEPSKPKLIAEAIMHYEEGKCPRTKQTVHDEINSMIDRICKSN